MTGRSGAGVAPWQPPLYTNAHFAEEQRVCYEFRLAGYTIREIADLTGLSRSTVARRLECEIRETVDPLRAEYKRVTHDRYELLWKQCAAVIACPPATVSDGRVVHEILGRDDEGNLLYGDPIPDTGAKLQAIARAESVLGQLRKLHGLDAPIKVDATVTENPSERDLEIMDLINESRAKAAADEAALRAERTTD